MRELSQSSCPNIISIYMLLIMVGISQAAREGLMIWPIESSTRPYSFIIKIRFRLFKKSMITWCLWYGEKI